MGVTAGAGGAYLMLATDGARVQIGLPEVKLGILPAWGGTSRLPRVIGLAEIKVYSPRNNFV